MHGRIGKSIANLFTGLLHDGRDQATLTIINKKERELVSAKAARGVLHGSRYLPFNYGLFERAFLAFVHELTPADVLPPRTTDRHAELGRLATRLGELEHKSLAGRIRRRHECWFRRPVCRRLAGFAGCAWSGARRTGRDRTALRPPTDEIELRVVTAMRNLVIPNLLHVATV